MPPGFESVSRCLVPEFKVIRAVATEKNKYTVNVPDGFTPLSSLTLEPGVVEVIFISGPPVRGGDDLFKNLFK